MAGHSGGGGSGGGSTPVASSGGGLGGAGGSTGSGSGGGTGTGGSTGSGSKKGKSTPPPKDPLTTDPSKDPTNRAYFHPELSRKKQEEIIAKGQYKRPDPATYLSKDFIQKHLAPFKEGAIRITPLRNLIDYDTPGPKGGYIIPIPTYKEIITKYGGDIPRLLDMFGFEGSFISSGEKVPILAIEPDQIKDLNLPSGNEAGANSKWRPGGFTIKGLPEATSNLSIADHILLKIVENKKNKR